jgi:hypothetical protein
MNVNPAPGTIRARVFGRTNREPGDVVYQAATVAAALLLLLTAAIY